jgi:hypothetical protein
MTFPLYFDHIKCSTDIKGMIYKYILPSLETVKTNKSYCLISLLTKTYNIWNNLRLGLNVDNLKFNYDRYYNVWILDRYFFDGDEWKIKN